MVHQRLVQLGSLVAGCAALSDMDASTQNMVMGALLRRRAVRRAAPFSRDHESEADQMGLVYAAGSCFDPTEAPRLWERMAQSSGSGPARFMSTHRTQRNAHSPI
ncbi:MAG: M48 family metalloprotease [Bryobacterales bacterium]|nr:M48 family metalloprotease [Bryobacterales bacterium]